MEPVAALRGNPVALYFAATRPAFLTASLMACIIGLAVAHHSGVTMDAVLVLVTLIFAMLAHAAANVLNDYYDALSGTDAQNTERIFPFTGGSRFIQNGVLTLAQTRNFGLMLMLMVAVAGLWLMAHATTQLLYVGLAGLFIGWAYSAPPFKLDSRGMGELCITSGFLAIVVGTDMVLRKGGSLAPYIAGLPYALLATNLLYINQFPDRTADMAAGKMHWVARLAVEQARWGYVLLAGLAYGWLLFSVWAGYLTMWAMLGLLSMPLSINAARELFRHAHQPQGLAKGIKMTIAAMLVHGALLSTGLLIG